MELFAAAAAAAAAPLGFPVNWPQPSAFARLPPVYRIRFARVLSLARSFVLNI